MTEKSLADYANSPWQTVVMDLLVENSFNAAAVAKELRDHPMARGRSVTVSSVTQILYRVRQAAALDGYTEAHDTSTPVGAGFAVKRRSTLYNLEDGRPVREWVIQEKAREELAEALRAFVGDLSEEIRGKAPKVQAPKIKDSDLLAVYPMGDPHIGMYAWAEEAGESFDLEIAERDAKAAIGQLVAAAPPAETAILLPLGDLLHTDSKRNVTAASGNALDVDTRHAKLMRVGARLLFWMVEAALEKHRTVVLKCLMGNHDEHSSYALSLIVDAYFSRNRRVKVDLSPSMFWYYRHGSNLIGATHGHTVKMDALPGLMAADRPTDWGETRHRYWYSGHFHNAKKIEKDSVICEQFRTLAPKDAWTSASGYRAGRDMHCIIHDREYGQIARHQVDITRVRS